MTTDKDLSHTNKLIEKSEGKGHQKNIINGLKTDENTNPHLTQKIEKLETELFEKNSYISELESKINNSNNSSKTDLNILQTFPDNKANIPSTRKSYPSYLKNNPYLYIIFKSKGNLKKLRDDIRHYRTIKRLNTVDECYYLNRYGDVLNSGMDPLIHYLYFGCDEGKNPRQVSDENNREEDAGIKSSISLYGPGKDDVSINFSSGINNSIQGPTFGPIVQGWLAKIGDKTPRLALLLIDDSTFEIKCDSFRADLKENGINDGQHAFGFIVPNKMADGEKHKIRLIDHETGILVEKKELVFPQTIKSIVGNEELNCTIKGKEDYLFLINDSSTEIRQHYDDSYSNIFRTEDFVDNYNFKKKFCDDRNIKYLFFIIPDKSVVCKDLLPFEVGNIKRNYDSIKHLVPDFSDNLDHTCYFKTDTHINFLGGKELAYYFLNHINKDFQRDDFEKLFEDNIIISEKFHDGDLASEHNWSYSEDERNEFIKEKIMSFDNKNIVNFTDDLPEEFEKHGKRKAVFWKNEKSLTDQRVLIFRDSSTSLLANVFAGYFRELLLYWDHWAFNEALVEWYKPDIIVEIRTERFLEHMKGFL
jgi:hypothetical protein